jgi:hypothetical protein
MFIDPNNTIICSHFYSFYVQQAIKMYWSFNINIIKSQVFFLSYINIYLYIIHLHFGRNVFISLTYFHLSSLCHPYGIPVSCSVSVRHIASFFCVGFMWLGFVEELFFQYISIFLVHTSFHIQEKYTTSCYYLKNKLVYIFTSAHT